MWEITALLKERGALVRSTNPGKILYQDSYQIAVEEWKKLR
jgi:hypothetical protein